MKAKLDNIIVKKTSIIDQIPIKCDFSEILDIVISDKHQYEVTYIGGYLHIIVLNSDGALIYPLFEILNDGELNIGIEDLETYLKSYKRTFKIDKLLDINI